MTFQEKLRDTGTLELFKLNFHNEQIKRTNSINTLDSKSLPRGVWAIFLSLKRLRSLSDLWAGLQWVETVVHDSRPVLLFKQPRYSNYTLTSTFERNQAFTTKKISAFWPWKCLETESLCSVFSSELFYFWFWLTNQTTDFSIAKFLLTKLEYCVTCRFWVDFVIF